METRELKTCPHCGREIIAGAKKCRYCKTWLVNECPVCGEPIEQNTAVCPYCFEDINAYRESVRDNKMVSTLCKTYETKPLSLLNKLLYCTFLQPPHVKLKRLKIYRDTIYVQKKKGKDFTAPISDLYFKIEKGKTENYYYIKMMYEKQMTRILRIDPMLSEEEWNEIVNHLRKFAHEIDKNGAEKMIDLYAKIEDKIKE